MSSPFGGPGSSDRVTLPLVTDLQRAVHVLGLHLEAELADLDLTQGEIHVLSLLGHLGTMSVAELQRGVRHRPSTLTGILDRLDRKGFIRRQINEADRRSNLIELTPQGEVAAERIAEAMDRVEHKLFASRAPDTFKTFRDILDDIARTLS